MKAVRNILVLGLLFFGFSGCGNKSNSTDVKEVHWDRDMCERCKMVVSDRHYTVQVINPKTNKSYMFDDIGCAVLWFIEEQIPWEKDAVVWINDAKDGKWIDAKKAYYDDGNVTPMAFGLAAYKNKSDIPAGKKVIDYAQAKQKIIEIKKKKTNEKRMKGQMH